MPVACCAPECRHRKRSGPGTQARHFFKVPLDEKRLALWSRNFPWRDLSHKDVLCDLHFREQDILKYFKHEIRGEVVLTPRGKWSLKPDAVPSIFASFPDHLPRFDTKPESRRSGETPLCEDVADNSPGGAQPTLPGGADLSGKDPLEGCSKATENLYQPEKD
ncbi:hypothetical protein HPB47_010895 [Ixodes persulcatus]|uniref:Uncharacterized protein n=1 Tax=Ixodes persulcatus TaxID=34615 RepID=A0AC60NXV4_IXOPE|nr:hypothetical protein HPB47_010895 [Ixodes persulcatus]